MKINKRKASLTSDMFNYSFKLENAKKLRLFAEYDFEYIHWCEDWNNTVHYTQANIEHYRQLIESCGLKCIDVHGTASKTICIDADEEDAVNKYIQLLENRIEFCSAIGGDTVIIHLPSEKGGSIRLSRGLDRSLQIFERVRPLCEDLGIAIAVENCYPFDEISLEYYFNRYPPEYVGFCFDSGHAHLHKNLEQLLTFNDRLKALHLHDNRGMNDDHQPPFWGTIGWERVMQWIEGSRYTKPINFEITHNPKFFEGTIDEFLEYTVRMIRKALALLIF